MIGYIAAKKINNNNNNNKNNNRERERVKNRRPGPQNKKRMDERENCLGQKELEGKAILTTAM